jgi:RNA polymerase sigma factor (TIGR02999 family)
LPHLLDDPAMIQPATTAEEDPSAAAPADAIAAEFAPQSDVTLVLQRTERGESGAAEELLRLVYGELRRLAAARMAHERAGHTLQPTALVHEAWLRLGADQQPAWQNRRHFFGAAAEAMRRIMIDHARRRRAQRHGGGLERVSLETPGLELASPESDAQMLLLDEALERLAQQEPRKAELLKQWCFVGLTLPEVAHVLGISERTASRDLVYAKSWLFCEMKRLRER